jgi:hypothetical protein
VFLYACVVRVGRFWSPLPHQVTPGESSSRRLSRYAVGLWYVAEFALAVLGIGHLWKSASSRPRSLRPSFAWLWGFLLVGCLMAGHVVYWTDMRMRAPTMPVVAMVAAAGIAVSRRAELRPPNASH